MVLERARTAWNPLEKDRWHGSFPNQMHGWFKFWTSAKFWAGFMRVKLLPSSCLWNAGGQEMAKRTLHGNCIPAISCLCLSSNDIVIKVCQMLSWRTKNWPHSINIWDTVTHVLPLCSVYQAPSYESHLTLLAAFFDRVGLLEHAIYSWGVLHCGQCRTPQE